MQKLSAIVLLSLALNTYSQNIEFAGKVESSLPETGKIYYTGEGKRFDKGNFITYKKHDYKFKMSIAKIKKDNIRVLIFAADTTQKTNDENACVQRINVGEIVNAAEFKNLKTIQLTTDLLLHINCGAGVYYAAEMENKKRFVGNYHFNLNDTVRIVKLENVFFTYKSMLSKMTKDHMTEEFGSWNYNEDKKELTFSIWWQSNNRYGLVISKPYQFKFNVNETDTNMLFTSETGTIKKM